MISLELFNQNEPKLIHLANLWNYAEGNALAYETIFVSNPHELANLIQQGTDYNDWQTFLSDSRVQDYIDRIIYTQAGITVSKFMKDGVRISQADATKLNAAIKYRDDHKPAFALPVQYIYIQTPLTTDEREFLPKIPENTLADVDI
jgi:hypothetical protein